jgi:hypothetical protein
MRRNAKVKPASGRVLVRKAALTASSASRRSFPAWIDAADGATFSAATVTPRVRDALVLRAVGKKKSNARSEAPDGPGLR